MMNKPPNSDVEDHCTVCPTSGGSHHPAGIKLNTFFKGWSFYKVGNFMFSL